ncbi:MAG: hypothetical protein AAGB93_05690 [Planctomycetota bacterium]
MLLATLLLTVPVLQAPASVEGVPDLEAEVVPSWRDHVRPDDGDLAFARIDWAPAFTDGLRRADAAQRPLLLWLMNGHPLGCT